MTYFNDLLNVGWDAGATLARVSTLEDYEDLVSGIATARVEVERLIGDANSKLDRWQMFGYCEACQAASSFDIDWEYSNRIVPNYRERLICHGCGLNNRQRFVAAYLARLIANASADIYLYEQVTPMYHWAKQHFATCTVQGSEYLGHEIAPGAIINGIRHEDALNLTFTSQSLDFIVSTDVYEHVPNIEKSLDEAFRVLRSGGKLLFSVPFYVTKRQTVQRAVLDDNGKISHLHEPQYHGNPISPSEGSLVFFDFGWDLLELCRRIGFKEAYALVYYNYLYGYLGEGLQLVFVAER